MLLEGYVNVCGLCCCLKPCWCLRAVLPLRPCLGLWGSCWCLWPMLPLKAWQMSIFCVFTWSHVDVYGLGYHRGLYWCLWPVLPRRPCWCPWPVLPPRVMMVSMACAVLTRDHVEVYSTCWHWRPCRCPWSMLLPKTMCKCMICVPADCKGQRNYFCSIDSQLRKRAQKASVTTPILPHLQKVTT